MLRRLSAVFVALTFGAGLDSSFAADAVILAHIVVRPTVISSCLVLNVYDTAGPLMPGSELATAHLARVAGDDEYFVAIYQGSWPATITLRTEAHVGSGCAAPLAPSGSLDVKSETFVVGQIIQVDLSLCC